jgi:copper/silver efflux system protein
VTRLGLVALIVAAAAVGAAGGYWYAARQPNMSASSLSPASPAAAEDRPILYYRDPSGAPFWSAEPKKDAQGRDYLPVYSEDEQSIAQPKKAQAAGQKKLLYYRNPMGLPDTSQTPKKDGMGMDYLPVYEGEDQEDGNTVKVSLDKIQRSGLGPDATGVGWVYQYVVRGAQKNLAELRTIQDWYIRYGLAKAEGVAEVASVGGFVKQYSVVIDPRRLQALNISIGKIREALRGSNMDVGGRTVELAETEYAVRGRGYIKSLSDLEQIVVKSDRGVPVLLKDVARIELAPDERRGITEMDGQGEVVSGIALQRFGENALSVIQNVKDRLAEMASSLPQGISIESVYDRSDLIYRAIDTLKRTLVEESVIVAFVCVVFLLHVRSALVAIITLPLGLLIAYICMYLLGLSSNIMSLGGIAIAIGAMVDSAIVMIENAHKHLERATPDKPRVEVLIEAATEVGPALFFSLLVITVSFLPIFALEAQEGRLFKPLAYTKTFAMAAAALLSVTLVPALMILFVRGHIVPEHRNPVNRFLIWVYRPVIRLALRFQAATILGALAILVVSLWPAMQLGSEFMPTLNEGTLFYMPTTLPGLSITKAAELVQTQDKIIKSFPEVASVWGKAGRASTATDPAPTEMFETVINLKPESEWRPGMTVDKLTAEMDKSLQFPGVSNAWTMPIKARIDMLSTGIRTPVGVKVIGTDLGEMEKIARQIEAVIRTVPGTTSAYAERVVGGYYLNIDPDRTQLARYGLIVSDLQNMIGMALGAEPVTTTVEGRERYTVSIRYPRDYRSDPQAIATQVLIPLPEGGTVPLGEVAKVGLGQGPSSIRTENAQLAVYIFVDLRDRDLGGYVADAQKAVAAQVSFPSGYYVTWSGQFEYLERAKARLKIVVPITILIIFLLLYLNFRRVTETLIVMLSVPFALVGGLWLMWWLDFNLSVAVVVGFIALAGVAAETGVVMLIYLDNALTQLQAKRAAERQPFLREDLHAAIMDGAVERVRPKMMTVAAIMAGLLPIMWSHGTGAEVMQRIAVPMIGGMVSSTLLTLIVIPAIYAVVKGFAIQSPRLAPVLQASVVPEVIP